MKSLSLTTFFLFLFCLCLRGYSYYTYSKIKSKVSDTSSILESDKRKSIALLNTLNDLTEPKKAKREIASKETQYKSQKPALEITFINDFYEPINNLYQLEGIQKEMREDNIKANDIDNSLESLPITLVYYLVIRENVDLNELKIPVREGVAGFSTDEINEMKELSLKIDFMEEILTFKNIPVDIVESEISQKLALDKLEKANIQFNNSLNNEFEQEEVEQDDERNEFYNQLPEEVQEQISLAEVEEVDLEEKLAEMNYSDEEIEEIIEGYQY